MGQNRVGLDRGREDQAALAVVSRFGAVPQPLINQNGPNVKFLLCREAHDEIQWLLATLKGGEVCLTAYTFDQPDLVEALIGYKGSVRMIADMGQSQGNRTKLQIRCRPSSRSPGAGSGFGCAAVPLSTSSIRRTAGGERGQEHPWIAAFEDDDGACWR